MRQHFKGRDFPRLRRGGAHLFSLAPNIGERVRVRGAITEGEIMDTAPSREIAVSLQLHRDSWQ
jgi:hypothetical protein